MEIREANILDKDFIVKGNQEICNISGVKKPSKLAENFEKDLFCENPKFNCFVLEENNEQIAFCLYSFVYWADTGLGIYISNIYVAPEHRRKGCVSIIFNYLKEKHPDALFFTALVGKQNYAMQSAFNKIKAVYENMITYSIDTKNNA